MKKNKPLEERIVIWDYNWGYIKQSDRPRLIQNHLEYGAELLQLLAKKFKDKYGKEYGE